MQVVCGQCRAAFIAAPHLFGKRVACPQCGHAIDIGHPPAEAPVPVTIAPTPAPQLADGSDPLAAPGPLGPTSTTAALAATAEVARGIALAFFGSLVLALSVLLSYTYALSFDFATLLSQRSIRSMQQDLAEMNPADWHAHNLEMRERSESLRRWGRWTRRTAEHALTWSQFIATVGLGLFGAGYYYLYQALPDQRRWLRPLCIVFAIAAGLHLLLRTFPALAKDRVCDDPLLLLGMGAELPFFFILTTVAVEAALIVWMIRATNFLERLPWSDGDLGIHRKLLYLFSATLVAAVLLSLMGRSDSTTLQIWIYRASFWVRLVAVILMSLAVSFFAKHHHNLWKATSR